MISLNLDVIGITLSVSAILSGASAFLLGFFLAAKSKGDVSKMRPYRNLIIILTIPALVIGISSFYVTAINGTTLENYELLLISIIASLVPPVAFVIMAMKM